MLFTLACVVGDLILQFTMRHHKRIVFSGRSLCLLSRRDALCWGEIGIFMAFGSSKFFLPYSSSSFLLGAVEGPSFWWGASNHFIETSYPFCSLLFFGSSTFLSCFLFSPFPLLRETLPDLHTRPPSQKLNGCCFGCCCCWKNWTIHSLPVLEQQQIFQKNLSSPSFLPVRLEAPSVAAASGPCGDKHPDVGIAVFLVYFQKLFCWTFHWFYSFYLVSFE